MAVQPLIHPRFRAFDSNGDPLSGGLLYSYQAGTTTPLATYTDRAGGTANANPTVLDANGEADVWVTPGVLYKFVLKDSAGVVQWTADNVPSTQDSTGLSISDGTVTAPGLFFASDLNTGLYRPAADQLGVATGGTLAALLTATQAQFRDGALATPGVSFQSDTDTGWFRSAADTMQGVAGGTAVVTLTTAQITALVAAAFNEGVTFAKGVTITQSTANEEAVTGTGNGTAAGVLGVGGGSSGAGVHGIGGSADGPGGIFEGSGNGNGITAQNASGTTGHGVSGASAGGANSGGVYGTNTGSGAGGRFITASGTGPGVLAQGNGTRGTVYFVPQASAPSAPVVGDVYYDSTLGKLRVCTNATGPVFADLH